MMRLYYVVALLAFSLGALACSSDTPPTRDQGQGGNANTGPGGSSGTGTGGGPSDAGTGGAQGGSNGGPATLESVCREAVAAQCQRRLDCGQSGSLVCFGFVNLCPEYYFGPDSTRTLEGIRDCVSTLKQMACTDVAVSALPGCLIGGARDTGKGCAFGSQCAGAVCDGFSRQCGRCSPVGKIGMACADGNCEAGAFCNRSNNMCEATSSIVHGAEGAACNYNTSPVKGCAGDLVCFGAQGIGAGQGTCTKLVGENQPCTGLGGLPCAPGLVCARTEDGGGACQSLTHCGAITCDASSYCNHMSTTPTCMPRVAEGKTCQLNRDTGDVPCVEGTSCVPNTSGGLQGACLKPDGARAINCADAGTCPQPLQCVGGHCAPLDPATCAG